MAFFRQLTTISRASEWWGYKLSPVAAIAYATASLASTRLMSMWVSFFLLLLALSVGAVYVSLINDWTDRNIDRAAGKHNRLTDKSTGFVMTCLAACLLVGALLGIYFWSLNPISSLCYSGAWVAYSLYSLPPFRLKLRGLAGVLADAAGAHLFPQLFAVALIGHFVRGTVPVAWWLAIGTWALACGIRNILWHQLSDVVADQRAGVDTFVTGMGAHKTQQLGERILFPVEGLAFILALVVLNQVLPILFLLLYALLEFFRWRIWQLRPLILAANQRIIGNEFYTVFFPLSILIGQCLRVPADSPFLLLHVLLFGRNSQQTWRDCVHLLRLLAAKLMSYTP
ncbi:UbiA family prenyltransferase [Fibrella arboris]|uniref:UbiA family prenyltransferase n=1 Tax=Fibrella arboris TaxID=3242486 RepID=UPI00351FDADB